VLEDVFACYEALGAGGTVVLTERRPFSDFIAWQQERSIADESAERSFWQQLISNGEIDPVLSIKRAPASSDFHRATISLDLNDATATGVRDFAASSGLSIKTMVQGAWSLLLSRYYRSASVTFGTIRFGRSGSIEGAENMIGVLSSFLPVHADLSANPTVLALLKGIQEQQVAMRDHRWSSLDIIRNSLPTPAIKQLADTCILFERHHSAQEMTERFGKGGLRTFSTHDISNIPLMLLASEEPRLQFELFYEAAQFEKEEIEQLGRSLLVVLRQIYLRPAALIGDIELLDAESKAELIRSMTGPVLAVEQDRGAHAWFEDQVKRTPDRIAIIAECELTYEQLDRRATALARRLVKMGIGKDQLVSIFLPRSAASLVAIFGILKSGAAYFPLDIEYPRARLNDLLEDGKVVALLTDEKLMASLPGTSVPVVVINASEDGAGPASGEPLPRVGGSQLAYAISTSGTTGRPKLIGVEHRQLGNLLAFASQILLQPEDVRWVAFIDAPSFDSSISQIFNTLSLGGTLVRIEDVATINKSPYYDKFACLQTTPSLLATILKTDGLSPSVRLIGMGAEAIPADLLEKLDRIPQIKKIINYYGPTEATVYCTCSLVLDRADPGHNLDLRNRGRIIGRAIANTRLYVVDSYGHLAPPGVLGELYIAGAPVARGYLNAVGDAAKNFGPDLFMPESGERMYRSGDLVCLRSDGQLEFQGRKDGQFKFNGVRIESAEIENVLQACPGIRQAVVELGVDVEGKKRVVAYLAASGEKLSKSEIRRMLRQRLPDAMIPHHFFFLDALPMLTSGKVDRRALALLQIEAQTTPESSAPLTAMEKQMKTLWEKNLSRTSIELHHDYFEMGGDSLSAVNLMAAIEKQFGIKLKTTVLFENSNIEGLLQVMLNQTDGAVNSDPVCSVVSMQESGDGAPLVILTGGSGTFHSHYANFARKFAPNHPVYIVQFPFALMLKKPSDPLARIAEYIAGKIMETVQDRPFLLFGHCIGALLAWHVAAVLRKQNAPPFRLVLYAPMRVQDNDDASRKTDSQPERSRLHRIFDAYRPAWEEWRLDHGTNLRTSISFARWVITNSLVRRGWLRSREDPFRFVKLSYLRLIVGSRLQVYPGDALVVHHHEEIAPDFETYWQSVGTGKLRFEYFPGNHRVWQTSILSILPLVHEQLESLEAEESVVT